MSLATDLMGFGVSPAQAAQQSTGGTGPLTMVTGSTSSASAATTPRIGKFQYVVSVNGGVSTGGVLLPSVGGDTGCLLADDFIVNNAGTTTIFLFASSGVTVSVGATNTSFTQIALHTTMTLYPISTTQWIGVKGS